MPHFMPHMPQLFGSDMRSAQPPSIPPHARAAGHLQAPVSQTKPLSHMAPSSTRPSQLLSLPSQSSPPVADFEHVQTVPALGSASHAHDCGQSDSIVHFL